MCETDGTGSTQLETEMSLTWIPTMHFAVEDLLDVSAHVPSQSSHELLSMVVCQQGQGSLKPFWRV